jgi:hypothetical protein
MPSFRASGARPGIQFFKASWIPASTGMTERTNFARASLFPKIFAGEIEMPKLARKRQSTLLRRTQIIETLRKMIIKYGSEHVTVRKLTQEIGVSEGAIYRHFKSKREILLFLINDIEEDLVGGIEKACPSKNPLGFLREFSRNILSLIE